MKDAIFISDRVKRGKQAKERALNEFAHLRPEQLNWKPNSKSWSIGECLEHLIISDGLYFDKLNAVVDARYQMNFYEKYNPLSSFWGNTLKKQLQEDVKIKMKAPKAFSPSKSEVTGEIVDNYSGNMDSFLELISKCKDVDIDAVVITSPAIKIATYTLRDAFQFLMEHEHRHINQGIRVKQHKEFPAG